MQVKRSSILHDYIYSKELWLCSGLMSALPQNHRLVHLHHTVIFACLLIGNFKVLIPYQLLAKYYDDHYNYCVCYNSKKLCLWVCMPIGYLKNQLRSLWSSNSTCYRRTRSVECEGIWTRVFNFSSYRIRNISFRPLVRLEKGSMKRYSKCHQVKGITAKLWEHFLVQRQAYNTPLDSVEWCPVPHLLRMRLFLVQSGPQSHSSVLFVQTRASRLEYLCEGWGGTSLSVLASHPNSSNSFYI